MRALKYIGLGFALLLLVAGVAVTWVLNSQSGAAFVAARAEGLLAGKLAIGGVRGSIAGPLTVTDVRYRDPETGMQARVERATMDIELASLFGLTAHVRTAAVHGLHVELGEPKEPPPEEEPFSLDPPIDLVVESFELTQARIARQGASLATIRRAELAARWTDEGIAVRTLSVDAEEGKVRFAGEVDERGAKYVGSGSGEFEWRVGELTYGGTLAARSDADEATLQARLTAPLTARLEASLTQRPPWPWRFEIDVPRFDPRKRLAPDTALESVAIALKGSGDREEASLTGELDVNGARLTIDPLTATFSEERIELTALTIRAADHPVTVHASGSLDLSSDPVVADVSLRWPDIVVPPEWAGQKLASRGSLRFKGHAEDFTAQGDLAIGPPQRLSDIAFALNGSSQALVIERFTVAQDEGRLAASGRIELAPVLAWRVSADATRFDPGQLLVAWPGNLNFTLASEGRLSDAGPQGTLDLEALKGTLRGRAVSGEADLTLAPNLIVSGSLQLASGRSSIRVRGKPGDALDATALIEIASLDDWVPQGRGSLNARLEASGRWPDIDVSGSARGDGLALGESRLRILRANFDVENLDDPRGSVTVNARELRAAGFEFDEIGLAANGSQASHTLRFRARGTPLGAELALTGGREGAGWSGTIEELAIEAEEAPRLALRAPVKVVADGNRFSVSESCLAGDDVALCLAATGTAEGRLQTRYRIENLPLTLVRALAAPDLPLSVGGNLQGRGEITRNADGTLYGQAGISSPSGYVAPAEVTEEPLLSYEDLRIEANLTGTAARVTLAGRLNDGGSLDGELTARELLADSPALAGRARIVLGSLRAIEIFTPQLAAVEGSAEARASFRGTPGSLGLAATAEVSDFAAEVPALGLKLTKGQFETSLDPGGAARFAGRISSADGEVTIEGTADPTGAIEARIEGNEFLAADIPAGRVIIDPELTLSRTAERMSLEGTVAVPNAAIDLTKLPKGGGGQAASPDVVVVDQPPEEQERDEVPLYTDITITLGPDVELVGFGLEAVVAGRLAVREVPGEEPVASGEVNLEGTYKKYGQDLVIERGRLLYAGTPLDNPQLDILAVREVGDVTAQLRVTGTAQQPTLTVSADPAMSQTEALSYLVRGKPLKQLESDEDSDVMQTAARSLGGAAGNLLAKSLGRRLGIDEIGIEQNSQVGGSVFTVGEYLSPRLYLSYGWGLFEPGNIVTLRYEISDEWALQASQGPQDQRAGIEYRIER